MRIRRIRLFIWILSIFMITVCLYLFSEKYLFLFHVDVSRRANIINEVEKGTKSFKNDNSIISKSVLLGYSNSDNLTIFSAFAEKRVVTVILSSYGYLNRRVYCRLFDNEQNEIAHQATVVFPEYTVKCGFHENSKFVGITVNKNDAIQSLEEIVGNGSSRKSEFTVCLAPIFGKSPKVLIVIEFIEYYKLQGADKFLIYIFDDNPHVDKILNIYGKTGEDAAIEVVRLKNNTECMRRHRCRHEMQLQDCVYRSNGVSKWVATVDLDERIMLIDEEKTIINFLRSQQFDNIGELRFRCQWTLRYSEVPNDDEITVEDLPMVKWDNTSHVAPQNHTTKSIVRPEMVDSMGVHGVQKFSSQLFKVKLIDPKDAVVRHYRLVEGWSYFLKEAETFGKFDKFKLRSSLGKKLRKNVELKINNYKL